MTLRVSSPYWLNWIRWHFRDKFRDQSRARNAAVWDFLGNVRRLPRGALVIDGGANVGSVTALFAARGLRVHAFEPDPFAFAKLADRFKNAPTVKIYPCALGVKDGWAFLHRRGGHAADAKKASESSTLLPNLLKDESEPVEVQVIDAAKFIRGLGEGVSILKLDIEGTEVEVINRLIDAGQAGSVGAIYAETHERLSASLAERTALLRQRITSSGLNNINLDWP